MESFDFDADATQEAGNYQPAPDGEYVLQVKEVEYQKTSTKKHMLKLVLEIAEGPYTGRKVWTNVVFNPKGQDGHGLTVQALKAFGFEHDGQMSIVPSEWQDRTCRAKLETDSYDKVLDGGATVKRFKNIIPTAGFVTDSDAPKKPAAPRKASPQRETVPAAADDDVPF